MFNGPLSKTTRVSQYQKDKTNLDFTKTKDSEWQWHQLGHMQVCTSLQTDNHASTPPFNFYSPVHFLPPNQQRQSTDGTIWHTVSGTDILVTNVKTNAKEEIVLFKNQTICNHFVVSIQVNMCQLVLTSIYTRFYSANKLYCIITLTTISLFGFVKKCQEFSSLHYLHTILQNEHYSK